MTGADCRRCIMPPRLGSQNVVFCDIVSKQDSEIEPCWQATMYSIEHNQALCMLSFNLQVLHTACEPNSGQGVSGQAVKCFNRWHVAYVSCAGAEGRPTGAKSMQCMRRALRSSRPARLISPEWWCLCTLGALVSLEMHFLYVQLPIMNTACKRRVPRGPIACKAAGRLRRAVRIHSATSKAMATQRSLELCCRRSMHVGRLTCQVRLSP